MSILTALPPAMIPPVERLSEAERSDIESILDAAVAWSGGMPIEEFARIGWIVSPYSGRESSSYSRYLAMWDGWRRHDPRVKALLRAVNALIRMQGYQLTNHGLFAASDLAGTNVVIR